MADGPVRDFAGTDDGEWVVTGGDFSVVAGSEAVPQGIRVRVGLVLGESYVDGSKGVDWIDTILVHGADPLAIRAELEGAVRETPDVTDVTAAAIDEDKETREMFASIEVNTTYSDQPTAVEVTPPTE